MMSWLLASILSAQVSFNFSGFRPNMASELAIRQAAGDSTKETNSEKTSIAGPPREIRKTKGSISELWSDPSHRFKNPKDFHRFLPTAESRRRDGFSATKRRGIQRFLTKYTVQNWLDIAGL
jgi:hypothetical protein